MKSVTTLRFRKSFNGLPERIKKKSIKTFKTWSKDPFHKSLRFKHIHSNEKIYSVRVSSDYRALGIKEDDVLIWFWIGNHNDYENLISSL